MLSVGCCLTTFVVVRTAVMVVFVVTVLVFVMHYLTVKVWYGSEAGNVQ